MRKERKLEKMRKEEERKRTQATEPSASVNAALADSEFGFLSGLGKHAHGAPDVRDCRTNETAAACKETALAT